MADEFYSIHPDAMSNPGPCHPLAINHEASRYLEFFSERYRQSQLEWERPDEVSSLVLLASCDRLLTVI